MDDLATWLRTQMDEDERVAREASGDPWVTGTSKGYQHSLPGDVYAIAHDGTAGRIAQGVRCGPDISAEQSSDHIARHNPARVLAEVEAKRLRLDVIESELRDDATNETAQYMLQLEALSYADQPGYHEEWRP